MPSQAIQLVHRVKQKVTTCGTGWPVSGGETRYLVSEPILSECTGTLSGGMEGWRDTKRGRWGPEKKRSDKNVGVVMVSRQRSVCIDSHAFRCSPGRFDQSRDEIDFSPTRAEAR